MSAEPLGWNRTRGEPRRCKPVDQGRDSEPDFKISGKLLKVFKQRSDRVRWTLLEGQLCGLRDTITQVHTKTCPRMFTVALFITAQGWKQPRYPSTAEQINEM